MRTAMLHDNKSDMHISTSYLHTILSYEAVERCQHVLIKRYAKGNWILEAFPNDYFVTTKLCRTF